MDNITNKNIYTKVSSYTFLVFMFFAFFGTEIPFEEKIISADELGTSNIVNQLLYSAVFIISFVCINKRKDELFTIIKKEKFLTILIFWCFASILWSDYPFISFKRIFQILATILVIVSAVIYSKSSWELIKPLIIVAFIYVVLSFISVMIIPEATDFGGGWRGFSAQKNGLGQTAMISLIVGFIYAPRCTGKYKYMCVVICLLSFVLIVGAKSITPLIALILISIMGIALLVNRKVKYKLNVGNSFIVFAISISLALISVFAVVAPEYFLAIFDNLGRDSTLTGRTLLWSDVIGYVQTHILLGCGFGGFWIVNNKEILGLYEKYLFLPRQAHMGYLDLLNEVGLIGVVVFTFMVLGFFKNFTKLNISPIWFWLFVAALIVNLTETVIFRQNILIGIMFLMAYLGSYGELLREKNLVPR